MTRRRATFHAVAIAALFAVVLPALPAGAAVRAPSGYRAIARSNLGRGVSYARLARGDAAVAHVAHVPASAKVMLRTVVSGNNIRGRVERTSSMCRRYRCIVGVNGDFFSGGTPVGGMVALGELIRSPKDQRPQLAIDPEGNLAVSRLDWEGSLESGVGKRLQISGVNVVRPTNGIVLYTGAYGRSTRTKGGVELGVRVLAPSNRIRLGQDTVLEVYRATRGEGNLYIPSGGAVLSGHGRGATALMNIWRRIEAGTASRQLVVRVDASRSVRESIGGKTVLLSGGKMRVPDGNSSFATGHHPRTVVGWNRKGDVWLVAIDGRRPGYSAGMSLRAAAVLMRRLGATEAVNLDGGGSTTFAVKGRVVNKPSGGAERPVANALLVVAEPPKRAPALARAGENVPNLVRALGVGEPMSAPDPVLAAMPVQEPARLPVLPVMFAIMAIAAVGRGLERERRRRMSGPAPGG